MKIIETVRRYFKRRKIDAQRHAILEKIKPLISEQSAVFFAMKQKLNSINSHLKYAEYTNLAAGIEVLELEYHVLEADAERIKDKIDELFKRLDNLEG